MFFKDKFPQKYDEIDINNFPIKVYDNQKKFIHNLLKILHQMIAGRRIADGLVIIIKNI
jgi:hypothetical protein